MPKPEQDLESPVNPQRLSTSTIAWRRHLVSRYFLRGLTPEEISQRLTIQELPCLDPITGKAWSPLIIEGDIESLEITYQADAAVEVIKAKARVLAEIRELRRTAWALMDGKLILATIKQECELMGFNAPLRIDVEHEIRQAARNAGISEDDLLDEVKKEAVRMGIWRE